MLFFLFWADNVRCFMEWAAHLNPMVTELAHAMRTMGGWMFKEEDARYCTNMRYASSHSVFLHRRPVHHVALSKGLKVLGSYVVVVGDCDFDL